MFSRRPPLFTLLGFVFLLTGSASVRAQELSTVQLYAKEYSTVEELRRRGIQNAGIFREERNIRDLSYPTRFVLKRVKEQDKLMLEYIARQPMSAKVKRTSPHFVAMAAPYGAGKSYTLRWANEQKHLDTNLYFIIDPDQIKQMIEEYNRFYQENPATAATRVHQESMVMTDILLDYCFKMGWNVILDSSLKNETYAKSILTRVKKTHPHYFMSIYQVTADYESILKANERRSFIERRIAPRAEVEESIRTCEATVKKVKHLVNQLVIIQNNYMDVKVSKIETIPDYRPSLLREYHIVFDIDWTIVALNPTPAEGWQYIHLNGETYRVRNWMNELFFWLTRHPQVKVSFFSGGTYARNIELLQKIKPPSLDGLSLYDVAYKILSKNDLVENHEFPVTEFSKHYIKDVKLITPTLEDAVILEDQKQFIHASGAAGVWLGPTYHHVDDFSDVSNATHVSPEYLVPNEEAYWIDQNLGAGVLEVLVQSIKLADEKNVPLGTARKMLNLEAFDPDVIKQGIENPAITSCNVLLGSKDTSIFTSFPTSH